MPLPAIAKLPIVPDIGAVLPLVAPFLFRIGFTGVDRLLFPLNVADAVGFVDDAP